MVLIIEIDEDLVFHSHRIGRTGRTPLDNLLCTKQTRKSLPHMRQRETY